MGKQVNIIMTVEKAATGFSAYAEKYPIFTTGKTVTDLMGNSYEAAQLYFEDEESGKKGDPEISFQIDFQQFFQYYKVLNAKFLAEKIGMNPTLLSQYVQGHKKPSEKQTKKILEGIHQIGQELSSLNLLQKQ